MAKDIIQDIWDRGQEDKTMTAAEIQTLLEPRIRSSAFSMRLWIWFYLAVLLVTLVLCSVNVVGYLSNPVMLAIQVGAALLSLAFAAFGVHLLFRTARIDSGDESVLSKLRRRLAFHRREMEAWIWIVALTVYLLSFAINSMVDNQDGHYRINKPLFFVSVSIGMVLFMYATMKIAQYPLVRELKAIVSDLEHQVTERTDEVTQLKRTWRLWSIALAIGLTLLAVWGLVRFFN